MNITPHTRRIIVLCIGITGLAVAIGWSMGGIEANEALLVIIPILTGFFSLLKGAD